jgi:hypothetical protein
MSECFESLDVAHSTRDENFKGRTQVEEHAESGDQRGDGDFVVRLPTISVGKRTLCGHYSLRYQHQ